MALFFFPFLSLCDIIVSAVVNVVYNLLCTAAAVSNLNPNPNTAAALDYKCVKLLPAIGEEQQQLDRFLRDSFGEENKNGGGREREWAG